MRELNRSFICILILSLLLVRTVSAQEESLPRRVEEGLKKGGENVARGLKEGGAATVKAVKKAGIWVGKKIQQGGDKLEKASK